MQNNLAYAAYNKNNLGIESPEKLIQMLYEGILRFISRAKKAMLDNNTELKVYNLNRANAIFFELINSLDYSQGDIAYYLNGLYSREIQLICEANVENNDAKLDEVVNVVRELIEAWKETTGEKE